MKTLDLPSTSSKGWLKVTLAALLIALGVFVWLPHQTKTVTGRSILPTGKKVEVELTLESAWGWATPDRLVSLKVSFDGKSIALPKAAYYLTGPFDSTRFPVISEKFTVPQISMPGKPGSGLTEVRWYFRAFWLSERSLRNGDKITSSYYATPQSDSITTSLTKDELNGLPQLGKTRLKTLF